MKNFLASLIVVMLCVSLIPATSRVVAGVLPLGRFILYVGAVGAMIWSLDKLVK